MSVALFVFLGPPVPSLAWRQGWVGTGGALKNAEIHHTALCYALVVVVVVVVVIVVATLQFVSQNDMG